MWPTFFYKEKISNVNCDMKIALGKVKQSKLKLEETILARLIYRFKLSQVFIKSFKNVLQVTTYTLPFHVTTAHTWIWAC